MILGKNQKAAIKKLEAAFLSCLRARLVFCGVDDNLLCTSDTVEFRDNAKASSACETILKLDNNGGEVKFIKTYRAYLDSGGS